MSVTRTPRETCVACGYITDAASAAFTKQVLPEEGCIAICMACGKAYTYNADLTRTPLSSAEIAALPEREDIECVQAAARANMAGRRVVNGRIVDA